MVQSLKTRVRTTFSATELYNIQKQLGETIKQTIPELKRARSHSNFLQLEGRKLTKYKTHSVQTPEV